MNATATIQQVAISAAFRLNGELLSDADGFPGYEGTLVQFEELCAECLFIAEYELSYEGFMQHIESVVDKFFDNQLEICEGEREVDYYLQ